MTRLELPPFRAAVWNLFGGTDIERSRPALKQAKEWGVSLVIACEARGKDRDKLFESEGFKTAAHDQVRIAWLPDRWRLEKEWGERLSDTNYFKKDGKTPVFSLGQFAQLRDLEATGQEVTLEVASYHTPAHVQYPLDERPARRYKAFIESLLRLAERANAKETTGFLAGGDDNWDEDGAGEGTPGISGLQTEDTLPIMLGRATGLRQVQAGQPTFGKREIDDYRILRLDRGGKVRPVEGAVKVIPGLGAEKVAHKMHMREFEWVGLKTEEQEPTQHACPECGKLHIGRVKV